MIHLLRVVHIVFGALWVGGVFFMAFFLLPSARAAGPASGPMMGQLTQVRQFPRWLLYFGTFSIVAGFWMYWLDSAGANPDWMKSKTAMIYGTGAIFALLAFFMGMMVNAPLARRVGELGARLAAAGGPPSDADKAQMAAMQAKLGTLANITAGLLITCTVCMAVARYVP
jgi:uncharacterized membrane protein